MNKWIIGWRQLFSNKCAFCDHCFLYRADHFTCNHEAGSWCGACRTFEEKGEECEHYRDAIDASRKLQS